MMGNSGKSYSSIRHLGWQILAQLPAEPEDALAIIEFCRVELLKPENRGDAAIVPLKLVESGN